MNHESHSQRRQSSPTLLARDGAVWLWPGVPLAARLERRFQPLPRDWVNFWVSRLHAFEADWRALHAALDRAAGCLDIGCEPAAQAALDKARLDRLSPEGEVLMRAVAKRLAIPPLDMAVGIKSLPWAHRVAGSAYLFDDFAGAASELHKTPDPNHPQWPAGTPDDKGGEFMPKGARPEHPLRVRRRSLAVSHQA